MATQLFEIEGGFSDGKVSYLSGVGAPGGDGKVQDEANVGSRYIDSTVPISYQKILPGIGTNKWAVEVSANKVVELITQVAHGFLVGQWVYQDVSGFVLADASDVNKSDVIGIVEEVLTVDQFKMVTQGFSDVAFTGITSNALFLSQTVVGGATIQKPESGVQKNLGFIRDNKIFVAIDITIDISDTAAPAVPLVIVTTVTTIQTIDSILVDEDEVVQWLLVATSSLGRFSSIYKAMHDGIGALDASQVSLVSYGVQNVGATIAGLGIGVSLTGSGISQAMQLTVVSTDAVDVRVRIIAA